MPTGCILVGYDGSPESAAALRWATEDARLRHLSVIVCHAWHWPYPIDPSGPAARETVRRMAEHTAEAGAATVARLAPHLTVRAKAVCGPPAATLLALSGSAEAIGDT